MRRIYIYISESFIKIKDKIKYIYHNSLLFKKKNDRGFNKYENMILLIIKYVQKLEIFKEKNDSNDYF